MASLFDELQRRNVLRVTTAYVVVAWLLAQVADLFLESFEAPAWVMKAFLLVLALGAPVAAIIAWVFELTPDGLKRESELGRDRAETGTMGRRLNFLILTALALAIAFFAGTRFGADPSGDVAAELPLEAREGAGAGEEGTETARPKSIAVLPFATFGGSASDSALADGLAETLLNRLAQIEELQVAARTSAFKFKDTNEDIRLIGEQLGVASVLEGSVQRSGQQLRITAQLIDVADGFHLYSETFDREFTDLFAVQDEIAEAVVNALQVELLGSTLATPSADAFEALAAIRSELGTASREGMARIIEQLEALIAANPDYAEAHATLSQVYLQLGTGAGEIPESNFDAAIVAARRAVAADSDNPVGHMALASALIGTGRFADAEPVVARALELQPGKADALAMRSALLLQTNRYRDAVQLAESALLRDPLNAGTRRLLAFQYLMLGRRDEGLATLDLGLELEPGNLNLLHDRANYGGTAGLVEVWIRSIDEALRLDPNSVGLLQSAFYPALASGDHEAARVALERAEVQSRDRLADERATYCFTVGDEACWHAATEHLLATRDGWFVQLWQARMLLQAGRVDDAIEVLLPVVAFLDETGAFYGEHPTRVNLAYLYQLKGETVLRDEALASVLEHFDLAVANGYQQGDLYVDAAAARAVQGDEASALALLEKAHELGFRNSATLTHYLPFDAIWERPGFEAVRARITSDVASVWWSIRYPGEDLPGTPSQPD